MKIYVITHKKYKKIKSVYPYYPLLVGSSNGNKGENFYLKDNKGNNISKKNKSYCELTGTYWIWKNNLENNNDIVGIVHYRRYFTKYKGIFKRFGILNSKDYSKILEKFDMILPMKNLGEFNGKKAKEFFIENHDEEVWNITKKIIFKEFNDYYDDFCWFENQKSGYCYNMLVTKENIYSRYCSWIFPILNEIEKNINLDDYDDYNQRMIGFIAERLMNVWVHHNNFKVKEIPVYFQK